MIWEFFYNAGWPLVLVGAGMTVLGLLSAYRHIVASSDAGPKGMGFSVALAGALLAVVGYSVPEPPEPQVKIVEKWKGTKIVYREPPRVELFKRCLGDATPSNNSNYAEIAKQCRDSAIEATGGIRTITNTVTIREPRIVYRTIPFKEIFEDCYKKFSLGSSDDDLDMRLRISQSCEQTARIASSKIVIENEIPYIRNAQLRAAALEAVARTNPK